MSIMQLRKPQAGNTLIEVLIATIVVGVILTGVVGAMTTSLKNSSEAQNRQVASRLAQEGLELFNQQKAVSSWTDFYDKPAASTNLYCIPTTATTVANLVSTTPAITNCTVTSDLGGVNTTFYRAAIKEVDSGAPSVTVTVTVQWQDGATPRTVEVEKTYFRF